MSKAMDEGMKGMRRSYKAADDNWKDRAFLALQQVHSSLLYEWIADAIWAQDPSLDDGVTNPSALGGVILKAKKLGLIENTGRFERSTRPATHGKPLPVWRSVHHKKLVKI